ncbi:PspC domain-containing protein [Olivibacter sp. SDN3]|uniref:PspC domain-containing protein n=1 Tax=Olivibacter sp. SDN3 TaxID=2764720 RepID=UPI00165177A3|nr:PspC domain-containing protein [Olivibacter sp. SDN3]QNL51163.1 PspC domain-containing protein [Olivibacter sp. SDN3]
MNKTIIININGIVFHIEEDAYEVLRSYMIDVKRHFAYTEDSKEIVSDIENRIAEMFNERVVSGKKEVITMQDVDEVCAQMGKVSDFDPSIEDSTYGQEQGSFYNATYNGTRKLFRDADDKVFGGVCAGLGHYLDIEALWVRLAMVLLFVFAGTGLLIYVILWIVVPQAKTRADRMAMKGEAPNLQNFKRNFDEEMEGLRGNFTTAGERIKPGLNKVGEALENLINGLGKVFVVFLKVVGALVIFSLCFALLGLLIGLVLTIPGWKNDGIGLYGADFPLYIIPEEYKTVVIVALFFCIAIPLFGLILLAIRILFNRSVVGRYVSFSLLLVWLIAVGTVSYHGLKTAEDFAEDATLVQELVLTKQERYYIDVDDVNMIKKIDSGNHSMDSIGQIIRFNQRRGKFKKNHSVNINILKSEKNEEAKLIKEFRASGRNFDVAARRAEKIIYGVHQQNQQLVFDSHSIIPNGELIRDQRVNVKMIIPVGTRLFISEESDRYIRNIPAWQCRGKYPEGQRDNNTEWVMTEYGLKCVAEEVVEPKADHCLLKANN